MARGPLYQKKYRPQFSGHETFPLRYGWLKKVYDRVAETENEADNKSACWGGDAIARFGVGKNMVASMRHWATSAGIIIEPPGTNTVHTTELGQMLFGAEGLDPYMEHPSTLWLIHWQLTARSGKTTWFWAFNHYSAINFEREHLIRGLERLAKELGWSRVSKTTLKNDVSCFVRTYAAQQPSNLSGHDDALESPLTELGIIKAIGKRDGFRFVRGQKATLGDGVFVYALMDFWSRFSNAATLSFETIAYEPGAPGRIFLLDENDIADRLSNIEDVTDGFLRWSETAGLKQIVRTSDFDSDTALSYISLDYNQVARRRRRNGAY